MVRHACYYRDTVDTFTDLPHSMKRLSRGLSQSPSVLQTYRPRRGGVDTLHDADSSLRPASTLICVALLAHLATQTLLPEGDNTAGFGWSFGFSPAGRDTQNTCDVVSHCRSRQKDLAVTGRF